MGIADIAVLVLDLLRQRVRHCGLFGGFKGLMSQKSSNGGKTRSA